MGLSSQWPQPVYTLVDGELVVAGSIFQNDAGQIIIVPNGGSSGSGHFDADGNIQVYDSVNSSWLSLTAPNGILTLSNL